MILLMLATFAGCSSHKGEQPNAIYQKYASQEGFSVAQVSSFEINDTLAVDVVLIVADNDDAWRQLSFDFDVRGNEGSISWLAPIDNPALRASWNSEPLLRVVASPDRRTVALYMLDDISQYEALMDYQLNQMTKLS